MDKERKEAYERKRAALNAICEQCMRRGGIDHERCQMHCSTGNKLRWLETEYADVTGWSHNKWS